MLKAIRGAVWSGIVEPPSPSLARRGIPARGNGDPPPLWHSVAQHGNMAPPPHGSSCLGHKELCQEKEGGIPLVPCTSDKRASHSCSKSKSSIVNAQRLAHYELGNRYGFCAEDAHVQKASLAKGFLRCKVEQGSEAHIIVPSVPRNYAICGPSGYIWGRERWVWVVYSRVKGPG